MDGVASGRSALRLWPCEVVIRSHGVQADACPRCGGPLPLTTAGAAVRCPYCGTELRAAPKPTTVVDGVLMVTHAIRDGAGNIYCAGYVSAPADLHAGYFEKGGRIYFDYAVWSYDADRKPRWMIRSAYACDGLSLCFPGFLAVIPVHLDLSHALTVSLSDGSEGGLVPEALSPYRQALLDHDGTYIVATDKQALRVDPARDWSIVPLFAVSGLFGHVSHVSAPNMRIALASDGDLVVHHGGPDSHHVQVTRYDRRGHRKLAASQKVEVDDTTLVPGTDGIVWARRYGGLRAITRDSVFDVSAPTTRPLSGFDPAMVALPDGSLLWFGVGPEDGGHVFRATTRGLLIENLEELP